MGTRSLTKFYESMGSSKDVPFAVIYRQYDGYPEGHGKDLAEILMSKKLVSGISSKDNPSDIANGMGCLAAQVVCILKDGEVGSIYLTDDGDHAQDYEYEIRPGKKGGYNITVKDYKKIIFQGNAKEMLSWASDEKEE